LLILLAAVSIGALLRFVALGQQSLDEDETVSVWLMHHSLGGLLRTIPHTESTPPLYYVLAWLWTRPFGTGSVAIRSLSACLGAMTVPVCFLAARELAGRRAGEIAAVLAALSPALVWYSQEARAYALFTLLSAASLLFFVRALRAQGSPSGGPALARWALVASLSLLTHYFALFLVAVQAVWLLAASRRGRRLRVATAVGAVAIVGIALIPLALRQRASGGSAWIGETPLRDRLLDVPPQILLGEGRPFLHWFALAVGVAAAVPVVWLVVRGMRTERRAVLIPVAIGLAGIALPALFDLAGEHVLLDRNALGAGVILLVACAVGMSYEKARRLGLVALVTVCALFAWDLEMVATDPLMQREDWRDAAHALGEPSLARAIVFGPNASNPAPAPPLIPFQAVYLKSMLTMPDRGWTVREVDELDVRDDLSDTSAPPRPVSPGRGFRLAGSVSGRVYTFFRFVAPQAVHVTPDELIGDDLLQNRDEGDTLVGLQIPRNASGARPGSVLRERVRSARVPFGPARR
jgi:Dolichyl-phosphate-mannose-protein mannosyltransferase